MDTPPQAGENQTETVRVQLDFPVEQIKQPIIWHLSHDYDLKFSIRRASVDFHAGGFTVLELTGPRASLDAGLEWVKAQGVHVSSVGPNGTDEWATAVSQAE